MKEDADASIIANSIVDVEDEEGIKNMISGGFHRNYANTSTGASAYKNNYNSVANDFSSNISSNGKCSKKKEANFRNYKLR